MILTKSKIFKLLFIVFAVFGLLTVKAKAGKIRRSQILDETETDTETEATKSNESMKSSSENAPISSVQTVVDFDENIGVATSLSEQQATTNAAADDATASLSVWSIVRSVWNWIRDDLSESLLGADVDASNTTSLTNGSATTSIGRTFGKIRRLQMALIPIIFKFGVLSAMVAFLVVLGMKTLFLLKLLVLMNAAVILGKFFTFKTNFGHVEHTPPAAVSWGYSNWNPHTAHNYGWAATAPAAQTVPSKEIHLHIHGAQTQPQVSAYSNYGSGSQSHGSGWERRNDPYNGYESAPVNEADVENELNNQGPIAALPTKYPANHRY